MLDNAEPRVYPINQIKCPLSTADVLTLFLFPKSESITITDNNARLFFFIFYS